MRPSRTDPMVTAASESIGGPSGDHATSHWWWTPVRVVLAVAGVLAAKWLFLLFLYRRRIFLRV